MLDLTTMNSQTRLNPTACKEFTYSQFTPAGWEEVNGNAILETPISLTVNGEIWLTFMCTSTDLEALALGFLYNERVIQSIDEIASCQICPNAENIDVWINHAVEKPKQWRRTTGCSGGYTDIAPDDPRLLAPVIYDGVIYQPDQIGKLIEFLYDSQDLYRQSGGVHTSALSDGQKLCVLTEDIGRHNTLDKIAGQCLVKGLNLPQRVLLTTGRISSDMLQKAARIGAAIVISRTAASSLAIELAEAWNITLIGYARRDRFRVYAHPERMYG